MMLRPLLALLLVTMLICQTAWGADKSSTLADFETSAKPFNDVIQQDTSVSHSGSASGRIQVDFSDGSRWVTANAELAMRTDISAIHFWVRSSDVSGLTFRLEDSSGQTHQQRPKFPADGQWHEVVINTFTSGAGYEKWGGANDGTFHWPATQMALIVENGNVLGSKTGTLWVDDIAISPGHLRIVPDLAINQMQLGNVFDSHESAQIGVDTQGDRILWVAHNFWREEVGRGEVPVVQGQAVIKPNLNRVGYYELQISAMKGSEIFKQAQTSFVIITPRDVRAMKNSPFGVMTHFAQGWDTDILTLVAKAGIGTIRDELYWDQVERKRGEFDFSHFDSYMRQAAVLGIDPLIAMTFANKLYDNGLTPHSDDGCDAYGRYGQAILKHYGRQIKWLEIWNEYNGTWCEGPAATDRPRYYAKMLNAANARIKELRPDVDVLGGAAVLIPLPYFEGIFKNGGLNSMDGVVIHPYRQTPEGVDQDVGELQTLMTRYDGNKPVWVTETGRIDASADGRQNIARYLVRQYALLLTRNPKMICWYLMRDYSTFRSMGLLRDTNDPMGRYAPAPAFAAYANLITQLYGKTFIGREKTDSHTYVLNFGAAADQTRVCWATDQTSLAFDATGTVEVTNLMGDTRTLTPVNGQIFLTLSDAAIFVRGPITGISRAPWLTIQPEQTIDLLDVPALKITVAGSLPAGDIQINGVSISLGDPTLKNLNTAVTATYHLRYEMHVRGTPCGYGMIKLNVADPLVVEEHCRMLDAEHMEVLISDTSAKIGYTLRQIDCRIGGQTLAFETNELIAPQQRMKVVLRIPAQRPYQTERAHISLKFDGRPSAAFDGPITYRPSLRYHEGASNPTFSLGSHAWAHAQMAWDEQGLIFTITAPATAVSEGILIGLTPADTKDISQGWHEFQVSEVGVVQRLFAPAGMPTGEVLTAKVTRTQDDTRTTVNIRLPWAELKPMAPCPQSLALAVAVGLPSRQLTYGRGIIGGKSARRFEEFLLTENLNSTPDAASVRFSREVLQVGPRVSAGPLITDASTDYSQIQGRNNWYYGYFDGTGAGSGNGLPPTGAYTDDDFKPMTYIETMWGYEWAGPMPFLKLTPDGGHPQAKEGKPVWAVRRWLSTIDGSVVITGQMARTSPEGDGVECVILVDGVVAFARHVGGKSQDDMTYETAVAVKKGSRVDFAITPGAGTDINSDATTFTIRIARKAD